MALSHSYTFSNSFTRTHAKYLASKIAADLYQFKLRYGKPEGDVIDAYQNELIELLGNEWLAFYEFGFLVDGNRLLSYRYRVDASGTITQDSAPGGILPRIDVSNAEYFNRVTYSSAWWSLSPEGRERIRGQLPVKRSVTADPTDGTGRWMVERSYVSGRAVERSVFRPW